MSHSGSTPFARPPNSVVGAADGGRGRALGGSAHDADTNPRCIPGSRAPLPPPEPNRFSALINKREQTTNEFTTRIEHVSNRGGGRSNRGRTEVDRRSIAPEGGAVGAELEEAEPSVLARGLGVRDGGDGLQIVHLADTRGRGG